MLYEMLSGVHPFKQASSIETINAILNQAPRPLSRYVEDVPELLEHTVTKMLAKDVDQRYQLVHDVKTNLIGLLDRMGATPTATTHSKQKGLILKAGAATAVVGIILGALWSLDMLRRAEPVPSHRLTKPAKATQRQAPRIAVLPFANFSGSQEDEVYSDGLTESLISRLANVQALLVISRTSVMRFKGKHPPIAEIARQLKADYIVEGSLLKSGNQCRVTAQLIRAADDTHLWAKDYMLPWTDIFTIQDEVSETVVRSINCLRYHSEPSLLKEEIFRQLGVLPRSTGIPALFGDPGVISTSICVFSRGRRNWPLKGSMMIDFTQTIECW